MFYAVRLDTLQRWLAHAEQLGEVAIAAEIKAEIEARTVCPGAKADRR